jgi:zinc protease
MLAPADRRLLERLWSQPVQRAVLPNGLTLLIQPDSAAPVASVQVWVKTGSLHEGDQLGAGLSHYLEHLLFKGTPTRKARDLAVLVQAHGGASNAYTTYDRTVYHIDLPAPHLAVAVDVLADMVLRSTLPAEEVARERDVILREIDMTRDDHDGVHWEAVATTVFREHGYRYPIIGHREVFAAVTREQLLAYYQNRYAPNNLVVVIAGDVDLGEARALVERHFGAAPRRALAPVYLPPEPPQLGPRALRAVAPVELTRGALAWPGPGLTHPDAPLLDLLATILGHGDSSVLWRVLRDERRLVHSIDAHHWSPGSSGLFTIFFSGEPGKRAAAEDAIREVLGRCAARGFTRAQIQKALRQVVVGELSSRKTVAGRAGRLGAAEVVAGDLDFSRGWFARAARATPADLVRVMRAWLVPACLSTVSLDPLAPTPPPVAAVARRPRAEWTTHTLPNGARLLLRPDDTQPNIHCHLACAGGPAQEHPGRRGASSLLATLLAKDTRRRSAEDVAEAIESVGGSFGGVARDNTTGLSLEVLPGDIGLGLKLLGEAMHVPAFAARTLAVEREAQLAGLQQVEDDVVYYGHALARRLALGAHPLALGPDGDKAGVTALRAADLRDLWARLATGPGTVLAVSGDFSATKLLPTLRALLAPLPAGRAAAGKGGPVPPAARAREHIERRVCTQALVFDAYPGPGLAAEADDAAVAVLSELLNGMSSRLFERVREQKGLAYFVGAARVADPARGALYLYAGTQPGKEAEVAAEFAAELKRLAAGRLEAGELARAHTRLQAARRMRMQTNAARAADAAQRAALGLPLWDLPAWDARVAGVDAARVAALVKKWFEPSHRLAVRILPR